MVCFLVVLFWGHLIVKLPFECKSSKYSLRLHLPYLVLLSISFPLSKGLELFPFYFQVQTSMMNCVPEFSVTNCINTATLHQVFRGSIVFPVQFWFWGSYFFLVSQILFVKLVPQIVL